MPQDRSERDQCVFRSCGHSSGTTQGQSQEAGSRVDGDDKSGKGSRQSLESDVPAQAGHDAWTSEQDLPAVHRNPAGLPSGMDIPESETISDESLTLRLGNCRGILIFASFTGCRQAGRKKFIVWKR